jgi:hypothetical protein
MIGMIRGTMDQSTLRTYKDAFYANRAAVQDSVSVYARLIDFGNTDSVVNIIKQSTDTATLLAVLSGGSPYISRAALTVVADSLRLPRFSMLQLIHSNPDNISNQAFIDTLKAKYELTTGNLDTLLAWATHSTARTSLEGAIGGMHSDMAEGGNIILMALKAATDTNVSITDDMTAGICTDNNSVYYMLDSNSVYAGLDSIDTWLQNIGGMWTSYARTGYYNFRGQRQIADNIFSQTGSMLHSAATHALAQDTVEYASYRKLWNVIKTAQTAGRSIYQLSASEIAALDTSTIDNFTPDAGAKAKLSVSVMYSMGTGELPRACELVTTEGSKTGRVITDRHEPISDLHTYGKLKQFSAYPNPTSGVVTFSYNVPDAGEM